MRALPLLAAAAALVSLGATSADATVTTIKHRAKHRAPACSDKLLCRKIDGLSARIDKNFNSLNDTVKAGQAENAAYQVKQVAYSEQMLTSMKAIEAQGGQSKNAILLSFSDRKLVEGETAASVATQTCLDAGFKEGKPVDVSTRHSWTKSGTYLQSVVCTF